MKKKTKGIILFAFMGGILLTSTVAIAIPGISPNTPESGGDEDFTVTGTPQDNFPDSQREQFCGTGSIQSNVFVKEYKVPTLCTQPLAVVTDSEGNVWFAQTNTGKLAKFDPNTESFVEFENPQWPPMGRSMMWGIDYSPDGSIWFTDDSFDSVWKFSIKDESYSRISFPAGEQSLPQRLKVIGTQVIVNDFTGNKITFFDLTRPTNDVGYFSIPSPIENSVTSGFALDQNNNLWYTNWIFQQGGVLIKFDQENYFMSAANSEEQLPVSNFLQVFKLPDNMQAPNGMVVDDDNNVWIADTASSYLFKFDPASEQYVKYSTSPPSLNTYGNASGTIKSPITRPYWLDKNTDDGKIVFNEQTANRIGLFDPSKESLVEYLIPSKNPNWADCGELEDCGIAQVFDFTINNGQIWFTEWVQNNIGVIDTTRPLPFEINLESSELTLKPGTSNTIDLQVIPSSSNNIKIVTAGDPSLRVDSDSVTREITKDKAITVPIDIAATPETPPGTYKVLVGVQDSDVAYSKYITVNIIS